MSHLSVKAGVAAMAGMVVAVVAALLGVPELSPLLGWVVASAVVLALLRSQQKDAVGSAAAILAVVGVVAAWALINTVYAFKYARMYYLDDNHRFDFDQDEDPAYSDFAYTAFAIGMAYSASNVTESSTPSRRIALGHALLSYFFGTFVVAVAINLITGLTQGG
ncbi:DUF1345 domain-containing protein [Herbiconiux sp. KACC 21604]|uniref:DUF1345 domain-containing protein n=1 Tax=unclassified Herbiconiux TaxID=2618217 RepID=UPI0020A2FF6A|nr:DUF1345 domain-containing protein [Herbiconiux sp. SALV-R1]WPO86237.1 DUF1345 domain-containing protein [Herbiconiux sp. KACC 21604]